MTHPIRAISFSPPALDCDCGHGLTADTPDELDAAYRAHRAAVGATHESKIRAPKVRAEHQRGLPLDPELYAYWDLL